MAGLRERNMAPKFPDQDPDDGGRPVRHYHQEGKAEDALIPVISCWFAEVAATRTRVADGVTQEDSVLRTLPPSMARLEQTRHPSPTTTMLTDDAFFVSKQRRQAQTSASTPTEKLLMTSNAQSEEYPK